MITMDGLNSPAPTTVTARICVVGRISETNINTDLHELKSSNITSQFLETQQREVGLYNVYPKNIISQHAFERKSDGCRFNVV